MRIKVLAFAVSLLLISNASLGVPQATPATTSSQAASALQGAMAALVGKSAVNDATLTGTVEWIAGSDDETGTATYKGISGAYRLDMTFRNGTRSEVVSSGSGASQGSWIGLDGVSHAVAEHNLIVDAGWFPTFTVASINQSSNYILTYLGQETRNGSSVIHVRVTQQFPYLTGDTATFMQHLSQVEIYFNSTTFLPVSYSFNSHPDNNAALDIPTEIRYSNYANVNGAQIPLHVQKFMNDSLVLDLQFQNSSLNTGLSVSQISAQ